MISRRAVVAGIALGSLGTRAMAQALPRIAIVEQGEPVERMVEGGHPWWSALIVALRGLGHIEGEAIVIDRWTAAGQNDAGYTAMARAIVETGPDVIIARGTRALTAAMNATTAIPIVGLSNFPPGINLARPGGNLTGINVTAGPEIYMKQLELLRAATPGAIEVAWLGPGESYWNGPIGAAARDAATTLGLTLTPYLVESPTNIETISAAFGRLVGARPDGLFVSSSPDMTPHRGVIAALATEAGLPAVALQREYADAGLLMAYGPDFLDVCRRAAGYVDRILRGAKPAEMAIEQPTKFEFIVNIATAEALGITLPQETMLFATEIIE